MTPFAIAVFARFLWYVLALAIAGVPFYLLIAGKTRLAVPARIALATLAGSAFLASIWWAVASVAGMAAVDMADLSRATFFAVLDATPLGNVLAIRLVACACIVVAVAASARCLPAAFFGGVALASSAWTGHSGATQGIAGVAQRLLDVVHLGAASLWLGALCVFLACVLKGPDRSELTERLTGFARIGTAVVIALAITGSINALLIAQSGWTWASGWTLLLACKIALFLAMLGFAALNRWSLTPAFEQNRPGASRNLRWSLAFETTCGLAVVALVAALGVLGPSGS